MTQLQNETSIEIEQQRRFWNSWNAKHREEIKHLPEVNRRQARMVLEWTTNFGRKDLDILDIGCGSGWLCQQLLPFGRVTGTDLSNEVLGRTEAALQNIAFVAGDFFELDFPSNGFDVVVSLEVLAHVANQNLFIEKISRILRPGGYLMLSTQNRFALE